MQPLLVGYEAPHFGDESGHLLIQLLLFSYEAPHFGDESGHLVIEPLLFSYEAPHFGYEAPYFGYESGRLVHEDIEPGGHLQQFLAQYLGTYRRFPLGVLRKGAQEVVLAVDGGHGFS